MKRNQAKHIQKRLLILVLVLLAAGIVLLQTAFFHINPIKIGYNRFDYGNCVIYTKDHAAGIEYEELKTAMQQNESTHGLQYKAKIQLILCKSQKETGRYLPFASRIDRKNAVAFAPWPNTIYITPKAKEKYGDLHGVLAHELSHILLLQNYGIINCTKLRGQYEWIPEGFAVFYAKWPIYINKDKMKETISNAKIDTMNGELLGDKHPQEVILPVRFMIYYYFIDYLRQKNDESSLAGFLQKACSHPGRVESIFTESFGRPLPEYVKMFAESLIE